MLARPAGNSTDHLARQAGPIEPTLSGDDQLGPVERVVEPGRARDDVEAGLETRADRRESAGEPARSAAAFDGAYVATGARFVLLREADEAAPEQCDLRVGRALLRAVDARGVEKGRRDVARDRDVDGRKRPAQRVERAEATVGRGTSTDPDDDPAGPAARGRTDQLARPAARGPQRVVAPRDEPEAARACHLDHGHSAPQHRPFGGDGTAERSGHRRRAARPADRVEEGVEGPLATVGEGDGGDVVDPGPPHTGGHGLRRRAGGEAAAELVRTDDGPGHAHRLLQDFRPPRKVVDLVLERVPLLEKALADYARVVEPGTIERIQELARPLQGARVLHVNATAYGGGVAELLATHVPLLREIGLEAEWHVIRGSDEFFHITKAVHNGLQGADVEWTPAMERAYLERVLSNALDLEGEWDFIVIHDPQPAALRDYARGRPVDHADTAWIWRCHIDLTDANPTLWNFFQPFVEQYDASVWTMPEFVPASLDMDNIVQAPPCIDPLSVKNLELPDPFVREICRQYGVDVDRPILCQVSRFDPWKDPIGVIESFRLVRDEVPGTQLVLAGSMATDDPEGFHMWELTETARDGDPDIHLVSNIQQVGAVQINAFQRAADVVLQKSLREGFGLTVSEGLWKGRPVIGGRAGGIALQIDDGANGFLVDSVEQCAQRCVELLSDPDRADEMGRRGRDHVRRNFLSTRELEDWLSLFTNVGS